MNGREADTKTRTVQVLLFSILREELGRAAFTFSLTGSMNVRDLLEALYRSHPAIVPYGPVIRVAVNQSYVDAAHPLEDGDEVALITPVSGG
jgi:molybdopterin converting factor subunit 1